MTTENIPAGPDSITAGFDVSELLEQVAPRVARKNRALATFEYLLINPALAFLPFLFFYAYFILTHRTAHLVGDETRYVEFAIHLLHGYYSPNPGHINLWNGPGYPILLMPFVALKVPYVYMATMNAVFQYLTLILLYRSLSKIAGVRIAFFCSLIYALYPNAINILPMLYTETFTSLLIVSLLYTVTKWHSAKSLRWSVAAAMLLGYLALTKVIFGYVIVICLAMCVALLLVKKNKTFYLRNVYILLLAFAVTTPYLAYTYYITGKPFYWGNSGGMSLYWMSTPYQNEYGDWKIPSLANTQYPNNYYRSPEAGARLKKNHARVVYPISYHNEIEQDDLFKKAAMRNIKAHPLKFAQNYYYNVSRMLFNFPYSYAFQDGAIVGNILRGSLILWVSLLGMILTAINWRKIVYPVKFGLMLTAVYLLLSGALSAYPRQLDVILPAMIFWIGFLVAGLKVRVKFRVK